MTYEEAPYRFIYNSNLNFIVEEQAAFAMADYAWTIWTPPTVTAQSLQTAWTAPVLTKPDDLTWPLYFSFLHRILRVTAMWLPRTVPASRVMNACHIAMHTMGPWAITGFNGISCVIRSNKFSLVSPAKDCALIALGTSNNVEPVGFFPVYKYTDMHENAHGSSFAVHTSPIIPTTEHSTEKCLANGCAFEIKKCTQTTKKDYDNARILP